MRFWFLIFAALSVCFDPELISNESEESAASYDEACENLLNILSGEWVARGVYTAAKLEIADHLQQGSKSIEELSQLTMSDTNFLVRLLRLLANFGIFEEISPEIFANTEMSRLLIKKSPHTLHNLTLLYGEEIHRSWDELFFSIKTGSPAFEHSFKMPAISYLKDNPDRAFLFKKAMKEKSEAVIQSALSRYDFSQFGSICDVGGGSGEFIEALLHANPHLSGVLFDLPQVIEEVKEKSSERYELVSGDFFEFIPKGKDAYLLKSVIHEWSDSKAEQILRNCYEAMRSDSRLIIVEMVLQHNEENSYAKCMDVLNMAITGRRERSLCEIDALLKKSGFIVERIYPTATEFSLLEVRKLRK